ncbi:hypothetical protein BCR36DRAFT_585102 [Piromyces finnis]|uniref:Uncharacterized protein n=1 Tax=Piromyces finnis TaxID=1754191 RepID=A0A1Y1V3U2_9FUNG|nr:hypothetical protein BCR36DRAFT_585102 [Piromyces finnis]|eukprot:ORX46636.1 hypothetical protein BCR36DRAFT_585102 [Piromyces finnis]
MSDTKNFLTSLATLRDSTKYVLDFLNNQNFTYADIDNGSNSDKNEEINCSQAFDVLKTLKKDVKTFTNTNFANADSVDSGSEEFKDCETADLDNLHSQLSMIVDNFSSDIDIITNAENSSDSKKYKLDIVLSHQETLKSIDKSIINQIDSNSPEKENIEINNKIKNKDDEIFKNAVKVENSINTESPTSHNNNRFNNNNSLRVVIEDNYEKDKSSVAKNFLFTNTMPQTPEIEKIKNYITDVDLNKLNNIEIIKLILDSLVQTCNELLQLKSDTLSDVLGAYPKSPLSSDIIPQNNSIPSPNVNNSNHEEKLKNVDGNNDKNDNNETATPKISINTSIEAIGSEIKPDDMESLGNPNKQRNPKELIKELECLIILIHSLYENQPKSEKDEISIHSDDKSRSGFGKENQNDSMISLITSNAELNSVINAIDSLLKASPRFNNQCVQINAENKKKFQLMGVLSVVDRMTRTRLNDQRASSNQLDCVNRLIELLNKSLVRQYGEQRFTISPDKEKKMEFGRISYLVEKSKNSRLSNQDWCSQKLIREKEIEEIFDQTSYKSLENQRFVMRPSKEKDMYINDLLKHVDKLDSYRLSNQDAIIKRGKSLNEKAYSLNSCIPDTDSETSPKRKEGAMKKLRRFSKSIMS